MLAFAIVVGGTISGVGMFNALTMSYTRLPYAMANERLLPRALARTNAAGVPWVSLAMMSLAWALALKLPFERLISIDLVLYGASLLLEFAALTLLRMREPQLARPFRIPGGVAGTILAGIGPAVLIVFAMYAARAEHVGAMPALGFAAAVVALGPLLYVLAKRTLDRTSAPER